MNTPSAPQPDQGKARKYKCALCGSPNPEHMCAGNARTRTPQPNRLEELIADIIALGTDHPNGAYPDGRNKDGTFSPQNEIEAKAALEQLIAERVREVLEYLSEQVVEYSITNAEVYAHRTGYDGQMMIPLKAVTALASADEGGKHED